MSATVWRRLLLTLASIALLANGSAAWQVIFASGDIGVTLPQGFVGEITVAHDSAAFKAGVRTGDVIDAWALSNGARYRLWGNILAGETLQLPVRTGAGIHLVATVAARVPPRRTALLGLGLAGTFWAILFGALLAWRRSERPDARILALLLIVDFGVINLQYIATPWPVFDLALNGIGAFTGVAVTLLATYALLYPVKHDLVRRTLAYAAYGAGLICSLAALSWLLGVWFGVPSTMGLLGISEPGFAIATLLTLCCLLQTAWEACGQQRTSVVWVAVSFAPMYAFGFVWSALASMGHASETLHSMLNVTIVVSTMGLWCALLNRRVLDLGFIVNRAAVFTGVSVVLLGTFVLVEWMLSEWLQGMSRSANIIVSALLALVLGLSIRFVHTRVDLAVDSLFFRKRHEDESAIRRFAQEAPYVTDATLLRQRAVAVLERHTDASSTALLLDDGDGTYGGVSENDPAIVRLRATHEIVDLHDTESALAGELAFPMVARARLIGLIVLGPRRSGEAYAPDESDAIAHLAHSLGAALDVLFSQADDSNGALRDSIEAIARAVSSLGDKIDSLPQKIDEVYRIRTVGTPTESGRVHG